MGEVEGGREREREENNDEQHNHQHHHPTTTIMMMTTWTCVRCPWMRNMRRVMITIVLRFEEERKKEKSWNFPWCPSYLRFIHLEEADP